MESNKDKKKDDFGAGFLIGAFVAGILISLTFLIYVTEMKHRAIRAGVGRYHPVSGYFEFIEKKVDKAERNGKMGSKETITH